MSPTDDAGTPSLNDRRRRRRRVLWAFGGAAIAVGVGAVLFFTPSQRESPDGMGEAVAEAINSGDNEAYRELLCRDGRDVSEYEIPVPGKVAFVGARPLHLDGGPFGEIVTLALGEDAELAVGIVAMSSASSASRGARERSVRGPCRGGRRA